MSWTMPRRSLLKGFGGSIAGTTLGIAATTPAFGQPRFAGETLHMQFWAGPEGQTIRDGAVDPFTKDTGVNVSVTEGDTTLSLAKLRAEKARPTTSVFLLDEVGVITGQHEGLLEPLDYSRLSNAARIAPRFIVQNWGIGFMTYITTLVYNKELVKEPPTSWSALWDPKYKGKIAIPPAGNGSSFQLAIMAAMLNGGDQYHMDAAWPALEKLKPNVAYMETNTAVLAELLKSGDVQIVMRLPYYFKQYIDKGYPIGIANVLREGIFTFTGCACLVKNHPDKLVVAEAFINELLGVDAQTRMANILWFGPTNRDVKIPDAIGSNMLHTEDQWKSIIKIDLDNLAAKREEWIQKYTRSLV
jgi:putative spermidine/putrescine transport system substrate-binding protein